MNLLEMIRIIKEKDRKAIEEFQIRIKREFSEADFILFGSKITGTDSDSSDIDVLVIVDQQINVILEKEIFNIGFEVGLKHNVVFGIVVEERKFLNSDLAKAMPFYKNVIQQGLPL